MKLIFILFLFFASNFCFAQPQWKFHIAFEDATGAKDTIWLIWDTTAHGTTPIDTLLGEGAFNFDHSKFNVWIRNWNWDSTKSVAYPYIAQSFLIEVRAFNYQYPITIRWDTSLFYAPYLPLPVGYINAAVIDNDYFFGVNNNPPFHYYNMLIDNNVIAPEFFWGSQSQFPMTFYIAKDPSLNVVGIQDRTFNIYPNPFVSELTIFSSVSIEEYEIITIEGKSIIKSFNPIEKNNLITIQCENLPPGIYFLKILTNKKQIYYEKIIKF